MKRYIFQPGKWAQDDFQYVGTAREDYRRTFVQERDYLRNEHGECDFVSMVTKEKLTAGAIFETTCAFEGSGAPLIVLSDDIAPLSDGRLQYGLHFEVVIYRGGCNIWRIDLIDGRAESRNIARFKFPVSENTPVKLRVEIKSEAFSVCADGHMFEVHCDALPDSFHAGITACEGPCRFYDFAIDKNN